MWHPSDVSTIHLTLSISQFNFCILHIIVKCQIYIVFSEYVMALLTLID